MHPTLAVVYVPPVNDAQLSIYIYLYALTTYCCQLSKSEITKDNTDLTFSGQPTVRKGHSVHLLDNANKFRTAQKNLDRWMATL